MLAPARLCQRLSAFVVVRQLLVAEQAAPPGPAQAAGHMCTCTANICMLQGQLHRVITVPAALPASLTLSLYNTVLCVPYIYGLQWRPMVARAPHQNESPIRISR